MSHASLIVAVSPGQITEHGGFQQALAWLMEPFSEQDDSFADGSRWDWWQIGGRYTGKFEPEYDPKKDPANIKTCELCAGTGTRIDSKCHVCGGTGSALTWPTQWQYVGDITTRAAVERLEGRLKAYAFLRDRKWHETGRLGWWGIQAKTECELQAEDRGGTFEGRCLYTCERTGAKIVSWGDDTGRWGELYWPRFIRDLPPDTVLVIVDYHV